MLTYLNDPNSTTPHKSTTKCALLFFSLAVSSTVFAGPPNEYIKSLTVNRIGQGPIYGNGVMTAKISIGYEVADGFSATPDSTGYRVYNTDDALIFSGWFTDEHDNGYLHEISSYNNYSQEYSQESTRSSDNKEYLTRYVGADKSNTSDTVEFCIYQNFKIYDTTGGLIDEHYTVNTCDSGNANSIVTLTSTPPLYLSRQDFYFENPVLEDKGKIVKIYSRPLFQTSNSHHVKEVRWWSPEVFDKYNSLHENSAIMADYTKINNSSTEAVYNYLATFFMGKDTHYRYIEDDTLYGQPSKDGTIPSYSDNNYVGSFIVADFSYDQGSPSNTINESYFMNRDAVCAKEISGRYIGLTTCTNVANHQPLYSDSTGRWPSQKPYSHSILKVIDVYGTMSDISFGYDGNRMVNFSD
ncbi:hypothetical protein BOO25_11210 [Vibrio navarrensis]|uniref:hypothetical protein n=1 Tax=Vibrio navarrensis TaxID=29495 RepID=UPI00192F3227|nr:hypothetical protein [Vibrio navarrensis]MBE3669494.1 hypothetical protein [Vibrio navarrensis]